MAAIADSKLVTASALFLIGCPPLAKSHFVRDHKIRACSEKPAYQDAQKPGAHLLSCNHTLVFVLRLISLTIVSLKRPSPFFRHGLNASENSSYPGPVSPLHIFDVDAAHVRAVKFWVHD